MKKIIVGLLLMSVVQVYAFDSAEFKKSLVNACVKNVKEGIKKENSHKICGCIADKYIKEIFSVETDKKIIQKQAEWLVKSYAGSLTEEEEAADEFFLTETDFSIATICTNKKVWKK